MNRAHLDALLRANTLTPAKHDILVKMLDSGVQDPCLGGFTPGQVKLWYAHLPVSGSRHKVVADVSVAIHGLVRDVRGNYALRTLVDAIATEFQDSNALAELLRGWQAVVVGARAATVLAAVAWKWVTHATKRESDDELGGNPVTANMAEEHPCLLIRILVEFRRKTKLRYSPVAVVDEVALVNGWWAKDSSQRCDAFLHAAMEELMEEDEWVTADELWAATDGITEAQFQEALQRLVRLGKFVDVGDGRYTTDEIVGKSRTVRRLIQTLLDRDGDGDAWCVDVTGLTAEQQRVVEGIASGCALTICSSPAGTGKTHTAGAAGKCVPGSGMVLCVAPTWKAVGQLRNKLAFLPHAQFMTTQRLVMLHEVPPASLLIVDESSMLTLDSVRGILAAYARRDTRLVFLGDDAQLPCIGRGAPLRDVQTVVPAMRLTQCMRTDRLGLHAAAQATREGRAIVPVEGEVMLAPTPDPVAWACEAFAFFKHAEGHLQAILPWEDDYVQMITPQNTHVDELNRMVQYMHTAQTGEMFGKCYVGDAVRCTGNGETYKNGDEGVLVDLATEGGDKARKRPKTGRKKTHGVVRLQDGTQVRVPQYDLSPAYACTVHKVQGSEYARVAVAFFPGTHPKLMTREMVYTSVTRAKTQLYVAGQLRLVQECQPAQRRTVFNLVAEGPN